MAAIVAVPQALSPLARQQQLAAPAASYQGRGPSQQCASIDGGRRRRRRPAAASAASAAPAAGELAIRVSGVNLTFTGRGISKKVLDGASMEVPRGAFHMLLGANGCGKSTLLRVLAGLFRPDAGQVHVDAPCGFVFQNPDHQVVMPSVAADVAFGLGRYDLSPQAVHAAVQHSLAQVGLSDLAERPTSSLSGGQKQRVAIAGALAEAPRVLLLDELTTFLDYEDQENVLQCVRSIVDASRRQQQVQQASQQQGQKGEQQQGGNGAAQQAGVAAAGAAAAGGAAGVAAAIQPAVEPGVTALWVTHRLEELEYADSVSYMDSGRLVFTGSPAEMRAYMRRLGAVL